MVERAVLELGDNRFRSVEAGELDLARLAGRFHAVGGAAGGEEIGAKDTGQIRNAAENRLELRRRLVGVVAVELRLKDFNALVVLHFVLEALLALVGRRHVRQRVGDIDLALFADRLGERARGHAAAQDVVGSDVGDGEVGVARTRLEHAVADEGVDAHDLNAGVERLLERLHQLLLVVRGDQDGGGLLGDDRIDDRNLQRRVPFRAALIEQLGAHSLGGGFRALVHRDIKTVGGQAGNESDRDLVGGAGNARQHAQACGGRSGAHKFHCGTTIHGFLR